MEGFDLYRVLHKKYNLSDYGFKADDRRVKKLIETNQIEGKTIDGDIYLSINSIKRYLKEVDSLRNTYLTLQEFKRRLTGATGDLITDQIKELAKKLGIEVIKLDYPITKDKKNVRYLFNESHIIQFFNNYISLENAILQNEVLNEINSKRYLKSLGIEIISISRNFKYKFIKKKDFEKLLLENNVPQTDAVNELGLNYENYYETIKKYNIKAEVKKIGTNGVTALLSSKDYEFLKELQLKVYRDLEEKTYTFNEVTSLFNQIGSVKPSKRVYKEFGLMEPIPHIARTGKFKGVIKLYDKHLVNDYIENLKKRKEVSKLFSQSTTNYYQLFTKILRVENVHFSNQAQITEKLWFQFVKWRLKNMSGIDVSCKNRVYYFRNATKILVKLTMTKEIHEFTEMELNLAIFNKNVSINFQKEIYSFLNNLNQLIEQKSAKRFISFSKLNFIYQQNPSLNKKKEIYSVEQYIALYNFVKDYKLHSKLAINSVKKAMENSNFAKNKEYKKYESMWLYVLIHMCNGWRNSSVMKFPRYPLKCFDELNINSIEDLENLRLSYSKALKIIKNYQLQWYEHNKNKEKATFYCSSELTLAMAYAIIICEFRNRQINIDNTKTMINFYNSRNSVNVTIHNAFFERFAENFKFSSKKMNSTVLVYTNSVIEEVLDDPIKVAQHLRGHTSNETTNIYYQIPQEHLDFLTVQLFDVGYFGFVYYEIIKLIGKDSSNERIDNTSKYKELKRLFGDVVKLEDTVSFLNQLINEEREVSEYLGTFPKEELMEKMNLINLGLMPAKEHAYQCFFATCIAKEKECNKCPFSIPNFYSLSTICKRILKSLNDYKAIIDDTVIPIGEKTKLFNFLLKDYRNLYEAKNIFGIEILELLLDEDMNEFMSKFHLLPEPN